MNLLTMRGCLHNAQRFDKCSALLKKVEIKRKAFGENASGPIAFNVFSGIERNDEMDVGIKPPMITTNSLH